MDRKKTADERVGEDMAEFMLYGAEKPELLERVQDFIRPQDGREALGHDGRRMGSAAARL